MKNNKPAVEFVEELLLRYGAEPAGDLDEKVRNAIGLRKVYCLENEYYRADEIMVEEKPYVVISTTDVEQFAALSILDDIAIFPADASEEEIDSQVRTALGIDTDRE
ncbi:MAG: hypothetical protein J5842_02535 [Lachnospiraceae bacterium]|nr:hypothetical protein [Lachnospiraceae bacterium]